MATLVSFHAHPDDEAIACGGTLAAATATGHRVVLVTATSGEEGEVPDGFLAPGQSVGECRAAELAAAARILGVARLEVLGYRDSGMAGTPANDHPGCFWRADVEEAAGRLAGILAEEGVDVLTVYDDHGAYGHPDHVQVHRVGVRAAELAGVATVYEATFNRDHWSGLLRRAAELGVPETPDAEDLGPDFGSPEALITTAVDVTAHLETKRAAMAAHASQIPESSFFLRLRPEDFAAVFGTEWYRRRGAADGLRETALQLS